MLYEALSWRSFPTYVALVLCCLILCAVPIKSTLAQQKGSHRTQQELVAIPLDDRVTEVLRFDTDLIAVDVRVMDREGRPVRNLSHHDFKLFEDDTERPISFFNIERKNGEQRPIAVVFALDISGSMSMQEMERLRGSMGVFSSWLAERPSLFAVTSFGMNVRVLQTFTSDIGKFDRAFARLMKEPGGLSTHTYDAIDDAIRMLSAKRLARARVEG